MSGGPELPNFQPHTHQGRGALDGVRIIDFTRVLAGPFCTQMLGDLGAEIIKIEDPSRGDDTRTALPQPSLGGESFFYLSLNRNKKSVAIDLKTKAGQDIVLDLLATADVLVENFTTSVMKGFNLDYAGVRDRFPRLIYCSVSAYGRTGRLANAAGYDSVVAAEAGIQSLNAYRGEPPVLGSTPYTDITTAMNATIVILAALQARHRYGMGQHVEAPMYDTALANLSFNGYEFLASGQNPKLGEPQQALPRGQFATADGAISITCGNDKMFRALCEVIDRLDWVEDPRFATRVDRMRNAADFLGAFNAIIARETSDYWSERFKAARVPCGIVRSVGAALLSRETQESGLVYAIPHPTAGTVPSIAPPVRMSETPGPYPEAAPLLGQHSVSVLSELLAYDEARIAELASSHVIGVRDRASTESARREPPILGEPGARKVKLPIVAPDAVLLITGATGAIGFEIAAQAAEQGAIVAVHGSRIESCDAALSRLSARAPAGRFSAAPANFQEAGAIGRMVAAVAEEHGAIDAVIHCAATGPSGVIAGPLLRTDPTAYADLLGLGVATFQELCFVALPHLIKRRGAIVAFASDSGLYAAPRQSLIAARMAAIIAFVRNLGVEAARDGVRVNCISPSYVEDTPLFSRFIEGAGDRAEKSRQRAGLGLPTPVDIAPLALFLSGPASARITGQVISINGGLNA